MPTLGALAGENQITILLLASEINHLNRATALHAEHSFEDSFTSIVGN
jgi:hypothetical protein